MLGHITSAAHATGRRHRSLTPSASLLCPGMMTRTAARLRRLELDRALADGADPAGSSLLAARAAQLATPATRYRIAAGLDNIALMADAERGRLRTPPHRGAIRAHRAEMLRLAAILRGSGLLYARGIALLELVLIDGTGPAYTDPRGEGLARQLALAAASLGG